MTLRRIATILLGGFSAVFLAGMFTVGLSHEFVAALLFVFAAFFGVGAYCVHRGIDSRSAGLLAILVVVVAPMIVLGGGFDLPETIDPIAYCRDHVYRADVHERWRESRFGCTGDVIGLLLAAVLVACIIGFWVGAVYLLIFVVRHHALPQWA